MERSMGQSISVVLDNAKSYARAQDTCALALVPASLSGFALLVENKGKRVLEDSIPLLRVFVSHSIDIFYSSPPPPNYLSDHILLRHHDYRDYPIEAGMGASPPYSMSFGKTC